MQLIWNSEMEDSRSLSPTATAVWVSTVGDSALRNPWAHLPLLFQCQRESWVCCFLLFGKSSLNFSLTKLKASAIKYSGCVQNERENISTGRASFLSLKKTILPEGFAVLLMVRREGGQLEEEDGRKLCRSHGQPLTEKHTMWLRCDWHFPRRKWFCLFSI